MKTGTDYGYTQYSKEGNAANWAIQQFNQIFGRDPTAIELTQVLPSYVGTDPHLTDVTSGNAAVASLYQSQQNTPQNVFDKQQAQYTQNAPNYYNQVGQAFQSLLGRDPTDAEKQHFGALMASGADPYQIQQALQQTTEYQNKASQDFTNNLSNQLQGTQSDYYNKYILPSIQSSFANQGRPYDSQAFANAAVQAGKQQNYDLQNYLASVRAGAYTTAQGNTTDQYNQYLNQLYGLQNAGVSNALDYQNQINQRNQQLQDYNIQQQTYQNYLNNYGKRNNGLGGVIGGVLGAAGGAYATRNPQGALAGWQIGSGVGSGVQGASQGGSYTI